MSDGTGSGATDESTTDESTTDESTTDAARSSRRARLAAGTARLVTAPARAARVSARASARVATAPARLVGRGVRRALGRPRGDLVIDDEGSLAAAERQVRGRGADDARPARTAPGPVEPPPPPPPRLRPRTIALVAVALAVPVGAVGVTVLTHERLAVRDVTVAGTAFLAPEDVLAAARVAPGTPLAVVDLEEVAGAVEALPEVADAQVVRRWPDELHLAVTERTPVTAVAEGRDFVLVDASGTPFRTVPHPPGDVPLLAVAAPRPGDAATADGLTVIQALPGDLRARVERVEVPEPGAVSFALRDGARVVWGGPDRSESKAVVLQALLPRQAEEYDVTAPEVAVTRG